MYYLFKSYIVLGGLMNTIEKLADLTWQEEVIKWTAEDVQGVAPIRKIVDEWQKANEDSSETKPHSLYNYGIYMIATDVLKYYDSIHFSILVKIVSRIIDWFSHFLNGRPCTSIGIAKLGLELTNSIFGDPQLICSSIFKKDEKDPLQVELVSYFNKIHEKRLAVVNPVKIEKIVKNTVYEEIQIAKDSPRNNPITDNGNSIDVSDDEEEKPIEDEFYDIENPDEI